MKLSKLIVVVCGEPVSTFPEIIFKTLKLKVIKKLKLKLIFIGSENILKKHQKKLLTNFRINRIDKNKINQSIFKENYINLIEVPISKNFKINDLSDKSSKFIEESFKIALDLIKTKRIKYLINGPISKKKFLKGKFNGITEYLASKTQSKKFSMLIYNKQLSVSPVTTHIPLSRVSKKIKRKKIIEKVLVIRKFYKNMLKKDPRIAITGLNPHNESFLGTNEEIRHILPAIKHLKKKKVLVSGPMPSDTIFLKKNIKKYDIIVGMYHDQVLGPIKALYNFKAINITVGLPFVRVSPDHGPNHQEIGKNVSNIDSFKESLIFCNKLSG